MEPDNHEYIRIVCCQCGKTFDVPVSCGNRFCEICCRGRRNRSRRRLDSLIQNITFKNGHSLKHLTLTIRNRKDCREMVDYMLNAFRKLRQRTFWKRYVDGGIFVIEITGRPGSWHVHLHIVIAAAYMPWKGLLREWKRCSGGLGVYIKRIPRKEVVDYLTKYLSKTQLPLTLQWEASRALKSRRLFQPFGSWHSLLNTLPKFKPCCPGCGASDFNMLDSVVRMLKKAPEIEPKRKLVFQEPTAGSSELLDRSSKITQPVVEPTIAGL